MKIKKDTETKTILKMGKYERAVYLEEHPEERKKINRLVKEARFSCTAPTTSLLLTPFLLLYVFLFQDGFQTSGLTWTLAGTFLGALFCNTLSLESSENTVVRVIYGLVAPVIISICTLVFICVGFFKANSEAMAFILVWSIAWIVVYITLCRGDTLLEFHPNPIIISVIAAVMLFVSLFFTSSRAALAIGMFSFYGAGLIGLLINYIAEKLYIG